MAANKVAVANKKARADRIKNFFKGVISELKKVHWPSKKQIVVYTGVVIIAVLLLSTAITVVDSILSFLLNFIL